MKAVLTTLKSSNSFIYLEVTSVIYLKGSIVLFINLGANGRYKRILLTLDTLAHYYCLVGPFTLNAFLDINLIKKVHISPITIRKVNIIDIKSI